MGINGFYLTGNVFQIKLTNCSNSMAPLTFLAKKILRTIQYVRFCCTMFIESQVGGRVGDAAADEHEILSSTPRMPGHPCRRKI